MLNRTAELTALFDTLGVLSCALMACLSSGWRMAIDQARAQIPSVEDLDIAWLDQQEQLWAKRHHKCVEYFLDNFLMSVLPRFYTGLGKLRIGQRLKTRPASSSSTPTTWPYRFPEVDETVAHLTSRCRQLRELDARLDGRLLFSDVSLTIIARNCRNLQKLTCSADVSDVGLAALAQGCKQLEHLKIGCWIRAPEFTHEGVMAVARGCNLLKELELPSSSTVGDPALVALGQYCPQLRSLSAPGWDRITDAAVAALVRGCPQLEVVELPGARMTDASASALAQGCPNLKTLDLRRTEVSAAGVLMLAKHAKQMLSIRGSRLGMKEARALEKEYPVKVPISINLKVIDQGGAENHFKCRETTPLQKLMHAFCNRQGVSINSARFFWDGNRVNETQTPEQLDMEDGDVIDFIVAH